MATATTKTRPTIEIPELAQKMREQFLSTVQQGQQISVDAAQAWVKAVLLQVILWSQPYVRDGEF